MALKDFWKKRKLLLILLIIIGLIIYFFIHKSRPKAPKALDKAFKQVSLDKIEPASQIKTPPSDTWINQDFFIKVLDEDLETGIKENSCQYKVISYTPQGKENSTGWLKRNCNFLEKISVGPEKMCLFEGKKACWVYVRSADKAGNIHLPSQERGSVKYYNVDWTAPLVGKVFINSEEEKHPLLVKEGKEYTLKVNVQDNIKVTGCNLYINGRDQGKMFFSVLGCEKNCTLLKNLTFTQGVFSAFAICKDAAKNYQKGKEIKIKTNLPPEVSYCKVSPSQGTIQTTFQFRVEALDPDGKLLFYKWDFGDGKISNEKNPSHKYEKTGVFKPKVMVLDREGASSQCSTAWITVK